MGKKKVEEEKEEGYEFLPPDFDEDAFIHKEMVGFRTTVTLFVVGIAAALVSWGLFMTVEGARVGWLIGMGVFAVFFALLKPLYARLHIDVSHYKRREWLGSAFLLFFTWLAFWLIFINPPISDFAAPDVAAFASPGVATVGDEVRLDLFYTDNDAIQDRGFQLTGPDGSILATDRDLERISHNHYQFNARNLTAGTYTYIASGTDAKKLVGSDNGTFEVRSQVLEVLVEDLTSPTGTVFVSVPLEPSEVYAVYLDIEGQDAHVFLEHDETLGGWKATRNFKGWREGNNTFTVVVEQPNRFQGQIPVQGGIITSSQSHTVEVAQPGDYAKSIPSRPNPTTAPSHDVPGPALPLLAASLVVAAFVVRRRRQ